MELRDPADPWPADFRNLTVANRRQDRPRGRGLVFAGAGAVAFEWTLPVRHAR